MLERKENCPNGVMAKDIEEVRAHAREIAQAHREEGDDYGWFESLYAEAAGDNEHIPWADLVPNKFLVEWEGRSPLRGQGKKALVVGCGLGDDAGFLAERGYEVVAFDVSETAIEWAKRLYPSDSISFLVSDLFDPPLEWKAAFDLVLEIYTIQALPLGLRKKTIDAISRFTAPGGEIVVVSYSVDEKAETEGPPWPLTREHLGLFEENGFKLKEIEEFEGDEDPAVMRFVARLALREAE